MRSPKKRGAASPMPGARAPSDPYVRGKIDGYGEGVVAGWDWAVERIKADLLVEPAIITGWRDRVAATLAAKRRKFRRGA